MADVGPAAFSVFFMQSPSFLAYQRSLAERHSRSRCQTLFGISAIPSDMSGQVVAHAETPGRLEPFQRLGGCGLIALDGMEHFTSRKEESAHI